MNHLVELDEKQTVDFTQWIDADVTASAEANQT